MPVRTKRLNWIHALSTVIRLRKSGASVENNVLEALKITLQPPSSAAAASPDLVNRIRSYMSEEDEPRRRKDQIEYTRKNAHSLVEVGLWNCEFLLQKYEHMRIPGVTMYMSEPPVFLEHSICMLTMALISRKQYSIAPPMSRKGRPYRVQIETGFTIQYASGEPYRTYVIAQPRHPGDSRLFGAGGNFSFAAGDCKLPECSS